MDLSVSQWTSSLLSNKNSLKLFMLLEAIELWILLDSEYTSSLSETICSSSVFDSSKLF